MDMRSKDILKNALLAFDGTLIVVSHDREFLDGLVDKVFEFRHHKVREHLGGIYDFLRKKKINDLRDIEHKDRSTEATLERPEKDQKRAYLERKELEKKIRKAENRMSRIESSIESTDLDMQAMDELMAKPDGQITEETYRDYEQVKKKHDQLMKEWEEVSENLERLKSQRL